MKLLAAICLAGALAYGQLAVAPPKVGFIQDSNHSLRPVLGLAGNLIVGDPLGEGAVSSAFSGWFGMVKTDTSILVLDRDGELLSSMDADAGPTLFAFSPEGVPAFVYLPQSQLLLRWASDHLERAPFNADQIGGVVLAIASPGPDRLTLLVRHEDGIWIVDLSGSSKWLLASIDGPVLLRSDGALLYHDGQQFVLSGGTNLQPVRLDAAFPVSALEQMGSDWVHVTEQNSSRHFAIRLTPGREHIDQLPEAQQ